MLKAVYGDDNVTVTAATPSAGTLRTVKINADVLPHKSFVFEMKDGDAKIRIHVPDGQVNEVGEVTYERRRAHRLHGDHRGVRDTDLNANAVKYIDDGKPTA